MNLKKISGQEYNVISDDELSHWQYVLSRCEGLYIKENYCHGVDENHKMYGWFIKNCFSKIKNIVDDQNIKLVFSMFLNETKPWGIHTDAYHVQDRKDRQSAYSILIPLSVDNNPDLVDQTCTIVLNQKGKSNQDQLEELPQNEQIDDNFYNNYLSHNKKEEMKFFSLYEKYQWKKNSLIFWDSLHYHDTDNFIKNGFTNKQAIVIHTYYDVL